MTQLDLIKPEKPINRIRLEALASPKRAYYVVAVYMLAGGAGYRIQKTSGGRGSKPNVEDYWRPGMRQAMEKQGQLIAAKTKERKNRKRVYTVVAEDVADPGSEK